MFAIIDLETTGAVAHNGRITEVAIFEFDGTQVRRSFVSLVNPERSIPPFITNLTGIDDKMVANAPTFEEIAPTVLELLEGKIFVAHNAAFDYGFIRSEFSRIGLEFEASKLCTVRLSRQIIPGMQSYSLGKLCRELGIANEARHRAFGDAKATVKLLDLLLQRDKKGHIDKFLKKNSVDRFLPANLPKEAFVNLPAATGVYFFHNKEGQVIYVGKAKDIKQRIRSHFSNADRSLKAARMKSEIHDISYELTGNELVALLLESDKIKRIQPVFNSSQRSWYPNFGIIRYTDSRGYLRLTVEKAPKVNTLVYTFPDILSARGLLIRKAREHNLCPRLCNLQSGTGPCYDYTLSLCDGACKEEISPPAYNSRVEEAIRSIEAEFANLLIIGPGRQEEEYSVVGIENGHYLGFGFFESRDQSDDVESLKEHIKWQADTPDVQRILQAHLRNDGIYKVLPY